LKLPSLFNVSIIAEYSILCFIPSPELADFALIIEREFILVFHTFSPKKNSFQCVNNMII